MENPNPLKDLKFEAARKRCRALKAEVKKLETKQFASPGAVVLQKFVSQANEAILGYLEAESGNPDLSLLAPRELELRVHRACRFVPFLYAQLGIFIGAEINNVPAEAVMPLRRFLRDILPGSEILLRSSAELNYSIVEIADDIRRLFGETPFADSTKLLPKAFFVISVPPLEANDILLHAILAHEAGHGIDKQKMVSDKIVPKVPEKLVNAWASRLAAETEKEKGEKGKTIGLPLQEPTLRSLITESVNKTIRGWISELCSDALALITFGPAYFFGFVNFFSTISTLDGSSGSHPPPRLRIRLMCQCMREKLGYQDDGVVEGFLKPWEDIGKEAVSPATTLEARLALEVFTPGVLSAISDSSASAVPETMRYTYMRFVQQVNDIVPLLVENIPAIDVLTTMPARVDGPEEKPKESSEVRSIPYSPNCPAIAQILNAGWFLRLARFDKFRANLPKSVGEDVRASERQLHNLILKSLELIEVKRRWDEIKEKLQERKNAP
ncbi:MAG: hypothetical protein ABSF71_31085 [Terriglobia bacterium]